MIKFEAANWLLEWRFRRRRCRCCVRLLTLLHVVAQSLKPVKLWATYKQMQQLPAMLEVVSRGLTVSGADFSTSFKSELIQSPEPKIGNPLADWWVNASLKVFLPSRICSVFKTALSTWVKKKTTLTHWLIVSPKLQSCKVVRVQDHIILASCRKPSIVSWFYAGNIVLPILFQNILINTSLTMSLW